MSGRVRDKLAIVTGGAGGLGREIGRQLVAEGAQVILTDLRPDEGAAAADAIGPGARFLAHDVTDDAQWQQVARVADEIAPVSILVNCAGTGIASTIADTTPESFRRSLEINLVSTFLGMKAVHGSMLRAQTGSIVNISSAAGLVGVPALAGYVASKFGVRGLTKAAATEFGPTIRVNSVHPGPIDTDMLQSDPKRDHIIAAAGQLPLGRVAVASEVAALVLYLASDESSYSTGAEFVVDAGWSCM